jgi:Zn-dependent protease
MERQNFLAWSFPVGRVRGVAVRADWTIVVVEIFAIMGVVHAGNFAFMPLAILIPLVSIAFHAWAHALAARAMGGRMDATTLWALGDFSAYDLPISPRAQFVTAFAGPFASACVFGAMALIMRKLPPLFPTQAMAALDLPTLAVVELGMFNAGLALWNLVPSSLFDGGRLWRALLWPLLGLRRAIRVTIIGGFVASAVLIALGIWATSLLGLMFGVILLIVTVYEHRSIQNGHDLVIGIDPTYANAYRRDARPSWLARWRERRQERQRERTEREEAAEQEVLDRLLAKVSAQGLPSLTAGERAELQRISEKQKKRLERSGQVV